MTLYFNTQDLKKSFGAQRLFENLCLSLFAGNRVGLIGPNGAGKSTLLKILADIETPDSGTVSRKKGLKIAYVAQAQEFPDKSPLELLLECAPSEHEAKAWLSKVGFRTLDSSAATLSGGWKKRLAIALALATSPDVLLIDEPTNHLDLDSVTWLEQFLLASAPTFILVSHDRYFLQRVTNRTIEINPTYPEGLFSVDGSFQHFCEKKRLFLEGQREQERSVATKARRETAWLRESPKARTTKAQARLDKADEILNQHADLMQRNQERRAKIAFEASERQTRKLLVAKNLGYQALFEHLDITLSPGTRLGLKGANGSGKTTLLRLLAGELEPTQGTIKPADALQIVYFDQHRAKLPLDLTLREALSPNGEYVRYRGQEIHVNGWAKRFLFSPSALEMPLGKLSGGERARLTIAHLMLQPADVLLLDEPTNDLDIPTLETLEETLCDFPGAVVLITHDRCLLEQTCTQFLTLGAEQQEQEKKRAEPKNRPPSNKISYKDKREAEQIERLIASKEAELETKSGELPEGHEALQAHCHQIAELESEIEQLYARWAELNKI